jgi:transposase
MVLFWRDDVWMADVEVSSGLMAGPRRRRSTVERRRIVEETLEAGASVARVALKYGVNANQVFQWRRLHRDGKLGAAAEQAFKLLPVSVTEETELHKPAPRKPEPPQVEPARCGAIRIELPGKVRITLDGSVDPAIVRAVLKSLRS